MKLDKVKSLIAGIAPMVGTALGGPLGGVAGQMVQRALGAESLDDAAAILSTGDPEIVLKLKQADLDFRQWMRDADIREEQLVVDDRRDARAMSVALKTSAPQLGITVTLTLMLAWVIAELFAAEPPKGSENVLFILLGTLTASWSACVAFFVGTTSGSARKTDLLNEAKK